LVFKTRKGVENISNGKLTLGGEASVSAGPVGRNAGIATDIRFKAEVMSYSRSRGLFIGVSLDGSGVTMDRKANAAFYGSSEMSPDDIFMSSPNIAPDIANSFVQLLTAQTRRLPTAPGMQSGVTGTAATPPPSSDDSSEVRTYGMPDPEE
jgi:lipid-binding SYLF domain-containing protein